MFDTLSRPYKESSAKDTINKIHGILEAHGLLPQEVLFCNPFPEVFSSRIALPAEKGGFGTNGKGRTKEYCQASAYAEFIERIQNGVHVTLSRALQAQLFNEFGFNYDPKEKLLTLEEFQKLPNEIKDDLIRYNGPAKEGFIQAYFDRLKFHDMPGVTAVPFYSSRTKKEEYLPINFLMMMAGTNGMAAGNSYDEAVYQALCELMERWAAALVFFNQMTPPTVPDMYLRQFPAECAIIDSIQESRKYSVTVKDFSAGRHLPAVGVLVHNLEEGTYRLNVGCDTSFQVALSRCLTEEFQGLQDEEAFDEFSLKIPLEDPAYFVANDEASLNMRYRVFAKYTENGTGVYPPSLFGDDASYAFDETTFRTRGSYKQEVERIIEFFHSMGYPVFIRDVSYLGFPSVYVYVPEVSSLGRKNAPPVLSKSTYDIVEADKIESIVCRFKHSTHEELLRLEASLRTLPAYSPVTGLFGIELEEDCAGSYVTVAFLLGLMWLRLGKFDDAAKAFKVFQSDCPNDLAYNKALLRYVENLATGKSAAQTRQTVEADLGQTPEVKQACDDLENLDALIDKTPLPKCPNCNECLLKADCKTQKLMEISRKIYPTMKKAAQA